MSGLIEPEPELAPDLEWMLQSGQVSQEILAVAMLREYYLAVYRMALCLLDDRQAAAEAAPKIFSTALLNQHRYRPVQGARHWLFGLGLRICLQEKFARRRKPSNNPNAGTLGRLTFIPPGAQMEILNNPLAAWDEKTRLAACLTYLDGWTLKEIGALLGITEQAVGDCLASARQSFQAAMDEDGRADPSQQNLNQALVEALQIHWPAPALSELQLTVLVAEILRRAGQRSTHRRAFTATLEAALVITAGLVIGGLAWGANLFEPNPAARVDRIVETVLVTRLIEVPVTSTPIVVIPTVLMTAAPTPDRDFGKHSSSARLSVSEMIQRLRQYTADWRTIWLDASIVSYGPIGYIGPPRITRAQLWLDDDHLLWVSGEPGGDPREIILGMLKQRMYYQAKPGQDGAWFAEVDFQNPNSLAAIVENLPLLINTITAEEYFRGNLIQRDGMSFRVVGEEQVSGRAANQVEQRGLDGKLINRFWIDQQTGLVLRSQQFTQDYQRARITDEITVSDMTFDVDFPPALFDPSLPWQAGYVQDYTAEQSADVMVAGSSTVSEARLRLLKRWAPDGFNPFESRLAFQYPGLFNPGDAQAIVNLIGDYYWLGDVYFGNPWTMICDRSPDGRKIAFVSQPSTSPWSDATLRWFTLDFPAETQQSWQEDVSVTNLAFAPDSQLLAVFGYSPDGGGVYVVNTSSSIALRLVKLADARSLAWSPDGEQLSLIGRRAESPGEDHVMVVDVSSGKLLYDQSIDFESGGSEDWPMVEWGIDFPVEVGGLEACVAP
jgi:DNA-directed RNA polymerase specialized sigma24 family protein